MLLVVALIVVSIEAQRRPAPLLNGAFEARAPQAPPVRPPPVGALNGVDSVPFGVSSESASVTGEFAGRMAAPQELAGAQRFPNAPAST